MQAYFDRIDEDDTLIGGTASYGEVHNQGLWHRGVHAIIYTPEKQVVMQKRAPSLRYHPNEIEVSAGGGVDAGETPAQAVLREIQEELGMSFRETDLRFIGKTKFNHRTKTQVNKVFMYSYAICVPSERIRLHTNAQETSSAFLIPEKKLRRALRVHRIKDVGKISSLYAYWTYLLNAM